MPTSFDDKPELVCEIGPDRVIAGRRDRDGRLSPYTWRDVPAGSVAPRLVGSNVVSPEALKTAVGGALDAVASRGKDVILVIPDASVRIILLDFESLPEDLEEALPLVRFRLRKSLPFDVEQAAISFHASRSAGQVKTVCAVTPRAVISEYESIVSDVGYTSGVVLPASLASLGLIDCNRPTMLLTATADFLSLALAEQNEIKFFRTVELPHPGEFTSQLAEAVFPAVVFYEDVHKSKLEQIVIAGMNPGADFLATLEEQTGVRPREIVTSADIGESLSSGVLAKNQLAAVLGAIAA